MPPVHPCLWLSLLRRSRAGGCPTRQHALLITKAGRRCRTSVQPVGFPRRWASSQTPDASYSAADVLSLENTLRAHRELNRASVIRRTAADGKLAQIDTSSVGVPVIGIDVSKTKKRTTVYKKVELPKSTKSDIKGTSRDLDELWQISQDFHNLPLPYSLPWLSYLDGRDLNASAHDRLTAEILAFEKYSSPTEEEQRAVDKVLLEMSQVIHAVDEALVMSVIGSRITGLADALSDLDINIYDPNNPDFLDEDGQDMARKILNKLYKNLRPGQKDRNAVPLFKSMYFVKAAKVPILLGQHSASGLPIQIQTTPRTQDSREYVKAAMHEFPSLKPLFKVLKQMLTMRGLTVGSSGGITSYPLLQMIIAALKFCENKFHRNDVSRQFMFFLDFYSNINFSTHGISIDPLEVFVKGESQSLGHDEEYEHGSWPGDYDRLQFSSRRHLQNRKATGRNKQLDHKNYLMTLQDPANPRNDLGKSCYHIQDVQETFVAIKSAVERSLQTWNQTAPNLVKPATSRPSTYSILKPCVSGDYRVYEHERDDLRKFGRKSATLNTNNDTCAASTLWPIPTSPFQQ